MCITLQGCTREKVQTIMEIPRVSLKGSSKAIPRIGMGTAAFPLATSEATRSAILAAIKVGYRHFDTASIYLSEQPLGEAINDALNLGLIKSRDELFITSKLWCTDAHPHLVLPALKNTFRNLQLDYLDLYLVHWPVSLKPGKVKFPLPKEDIMPFDMKAVWQAMEECKRLGLVKAIGVSNFSSKKLDILLSFATIPPVVNQVEVNLLWQQKKLREFCKANEIQMCAYSPLGSSSSIRGTSKVMDCDVLKEIVQAKGKSPAQICLRWVYEQGDVLLVKSYNEERIKQNLDILGWELSEEERHKISLIPQMKGCLGLGFVDSDGPYKSLKELWDEDIPL